MLLTYYSRVGLLNLMIIISKVFSGSVILKRHMHYDMQ